MTLEHSTNCGSNLETASSKEYGNFVLKDGLLIVTDDVNSSPLPIIKFIFATIYPP
jgi:hypothetical protein